MRDLPARRLATTALCATLVLGTAGPTAVASDRGSTRDLIQATGVTHPAATPVPGSDALLAQVQRLAGADGAVGPVTELLNAVLEADNGQLPADEAARLGKAVKDAIARMGGPTPTASATPAPVDVLDALQKSVDKLVAASTSGESGRVLPAAKDVLGALVRVVLASLVAGRLPHHHDLPPLPSLPPMPSMPPAPSLRPMPVPSPAVTAPPTATPSRPMI
ncbi:hypothetical protein [Streptomyces chiangmaiensis]|uniref:Secreted protein n=1 Tax=Streptomyces chiangmaiensis TaxID=766497 RepID=A0ABU7FJ06_9ACTN|nr:hypothetical protein [Streptomyces chiangmaiensis]MED7824112.1 hypothetical protein [Streptomyces chiangmaiensis]